MPFRGVWNVGLPGLAYAEPATAPLPWFCVLHYMAFRGYAVVSQLFMHLISLCI